MYEGWTGFIPEAIAEGVLRIGAGHEMSDHRASA